MTFASFASVVFAKGAFVAQTELILGIHSNVAGNEASLIAGHAWLTITQNGNTSFYGLWPDAHERTVDNGAASDIRVGLEAGDKAAASRYYKLSPAQAEKFNAEVAATVQWKNLHNCSSWASEVIREVVGEDVDADDLFGIETPREIGRSIQQLESRDPTSIYAPKRLQRNPSTSILTKASFK